MNDDLPSCDAVLVLVAPLAQATAQTYLQRAGALGVALAAKGIQPYLVRSLLHQPPSPSRGGFSFQPLGVAPIRTRPQPKPASGPQQAA
jgi:hypothetical protein